MKKIALIIPENSIDADPMVYPPLGLLYIAAILEENNHEVFIHDMREEGNTIDNLPNAELFCFTAVTPQIESVKKVSEYIRGNLGKFTIIGGAHSSWVPESVEKYFDAIVIGEGEDVINEIIVDRKKGIYDCSDYKKRPIDNIPFPSRHLLPIEKIASNKLWDGYKFEREDSPIASTIITSRGCPWKCGFCANLPQPVRFRSAENVVKEIEKIIDEYGCKNYRFLDDNFILKKSRLYEMLPFFKDMGISYRCSGRSDLMNEEIVELLAEGGCKEIGFGVESGDNKVLKIINKKETVEHHKNAISIAKSFGLRTKVFIMAGLPGETWESIELTKKFIEETKPDKWILTFYTPFPGSPIRNDLKKYGIQIVDENYANYIQTYPTQSTIKTDVASRDELGKHYDELMNFLRKMYDV